MIRKTVSITIAKHRMIAPGRHILAAVSGGADSTAMLLILAEMAAKMEFRLTAAHLNHRIRGKAAEADAAFVRRLCKRLRIPCVIGSANVPALARNKGISMEMAAREARYSFLASTAEKRNAHAIATAHNADDQAETVLLRIGRGTGLGGLAGISFVTVINNVKVIRPMLDVSRCQIADFLQACGQKWREDRTNDDTRMLRNMVRHEVLPFIESKFAPGIRQTLRRISDVAGVESEFMHNITRQAMTHLVTKSNALKVAFLRMEHAAIRRRAIQSWLISLNAEQEAIDFDVIERIDALLFLKRGRAETYVTGNLAVRKKYDLLVACKTPPKEAIQLFRRKVLVPGRTTVREAGISILTSVSKGIHKPKPSEPGNIPAKASIGLAAIGSADLIVRSWAVGDRMKPMGIPGTKKLQDIFVDAKIPHEHRRLIPVFECRGDIVWIPGYRVARGWEVPDLSAPALQIRVVRQST